jgi:hypothetical protein
VTTFTVASVAPEPREWSAHGSTFLSYKADLQYPDGKLAKGIEWNKKSESQPPVVGEEVVGHLEEGKYGEKFKIDYEATKELGGGGSGSQSHETSTGSPRASKGNWQPESERDPERAARILRQHSQEMALRYLALSNFKADATNDGNVQRGQEFVARLADFFDQDVLQAGQAVNSAQGNAARNEAGASTSQSASPGSSSPPADEAEFFSKLLQDAAMDAAAANELGKFMSAKFSIEQKQKAQRELGETQAQGDCIGRLRSAYEQSTSKVLPLATDDTDIPF